MKHFVLGLFVLGLAACQNAAPKKAQTVLKRLDAQITGQKAEEKEADQTYVAYFETSKEADEHAEAVTQAGGEATRVEASGKLLKVTAPAADFPYPVIGRAPVLGSPIGQRAKDGREVAAERAPHGVVADVSGVEDVPVDVELRLPRRRVSDPDRP